MGTRTTTATIRAAGYTIRGTYHGGAYIDLHFGDDAAAFDVINVWDYRDDRPTIRNTTSNVRAEMVEWAEAAGESLAHDLGGYAEMMRL